MVALLRSGPVSTSHLESQLRHSSSPLNSHGSDVLYRRTPPLPVVRVGAGCLPALAVEPANRGQPVTPCYDGVNQKIIA
jgi:hypothetical protein